MGFQALMGRIRAIDSIDHSLQTARGRGLYPVVTHDWHLSYRLSIYPVAAMSPYLSVTPQNEFPTEDPDCLGSCW